MSPKPKTPRADDQLGLLRDLGQALADREPVTAQHGPFFEAGQWGLDVLAVLGDDAPDEFPRPWDLHGRPALRPDEVQAGLELLRGWLKPG